MGLLCIPFLTVPLNSFDSNTTVTTRRRLLQAASLSDGVPEIANPLICLELYEVIVFRIFVDENDRTLSHYPVYVKNHLYNTNPGFDYGAFTELEYYITQTNVTYSSFAYSFTEPGTYVIADAQAFERFVTGLLEDAAAKITHIFWIAPMSCYSIVFVNSSSPSAAYMRQWIGSNFRAIGQF